MHQYGLWWVKMEDKLNQGDACMFFSGANMDYSNILK